MAKLQIYRFWYDGVRTTWPGAKLLYTDTDSAICLLDSTDFVKEALAWNAKPEAAIVGPIDLTSMGVQSKHKGQLGAVKNELGTLECEEGVVGQ